jgi:hypothetical protein
MVPYFCSETKRITSIIRGLGLEVKLGECGVENMVEQVDLLIPGVSPSLFPV